MECIGWRLSAKWECERSSLSLAFCMWKEGINWNQTTLFTLLNAASSLQDDLICKQIHAHVLSSGFQEDIYVTNSLVDAYGKCDLIEDARQAFEECKDSDVASFTSVRLCSLWTRGGSIEAISCNAT